jgi:hypothetical protein
LHSAEHLGNVLLFGEYFGKFAHLFGVEHCLARESAAYLQNLGSANEIIEHLGRAWYVVAHESYCDRAA